jgi:hypothetical protein
VDVGRSLRFITSDPRWVSKTLIGALIALASLLTAIVLVGFVGFFILAGYYQETTRRAYAGHAEPLPPWDNVGQYLREGFLVSVGMFLWYVPIFAIELPLQVWRIFAHDTATTFAFSGLTCLLYPIQLAWIVFLQPIVAARYAVDTRFAAMFELDEMLEELRRGVVPLLILAGVGIVATIFAVAGIFACCIGIFVTGHVAGLVIGHLRGQMYREARGLGPLAPPNAV